MNIEQFNALPVDEALAAVAPCVAINAWQQQLVAARPFDSSEQALTVAEQLSRHWQLPRPSKGHAGV